MEMCRPTSIIPKRYSPPKQIHPLLLTIHFINVFPENKDVPPNRNVAFDIDIFTCILSTLPLCTPP